MKLKQILSKFFLAGVLLLMGSFSLQAQGGFGHFAAGVAVNGFNNLESRLQQQNLLGKSFSLNKTGTMLGGGGFALLPNGLLLGGSGAATSFGTATNENADMELSSGGGFFNIGYAVSRKNGLLLYPYVGLGGTGAELEITNRSEHTIVFDKDHQLKAGEKAKYESSGFAFELGFGLKKFLPSGDEHSRGFSVGLDAGLQILPTAQPWQSGKEELSVSGLPSHRNQNFYLRLTFGGGSI